MVTIGIDTHKATLAACAVDEMGREVAASTFANDPQGHRRLLAWARRLGPERRFGIEGSGSFGAALARGLLSAGEMVIEVPATLTDRERRHLRRRSEVGPCRRARHRARGAPRGVPACGDAGGPRRRSQAARRCP